MIKGFLNVISHLLIRDLNKLKKEIQSYQQEENLWIIDGDIKNCAGNLCLHIVGNLKTYIGANLGGTGYIRQRDLEFSQKNVARETMIQMVDETIAVVDDTLHNLSDEILFAEYPMQVFSEKMTTQFFLTHLSGHLMYHLGQINYHRRLLNA